MKKLSVHYAHHVPKYMSCYKALVVLTCWAHCFHDDKSVMSILFMRDLGTLYVVDHL